MDGEEQIEMKKSETSVKQLDANMVKNMKYLMIILLMLYIQSDISLNIVLSILLGIYLGYTYEFCKELVEYIIESCENLAVHVVGKVQQYYDRTNTNA